jgi:hypothetical protein
LFSISNGRKCVLNIHFEWKIKRDELSHFQLHEFQKSSSSFDVPPSSRAKERRVRM